MSLTAVVKQRLTQGQTATDGAYLELIDMDEVEQLSDAYLTLNDGKYAPVVPPPPLTEELFKRYVRLFYDALRSTDEATDAYKQAKTGAIKKTPSMNFIDSLKMFEIQLIGGKLVKAVHKVQGGTLSTPSWPSISGLKFHKYDTFPQRMDKVIVALKTWKTFGKALFLDAVPMEKRLAMQPEEETKKKGTNKNNNGNRDLQLQFARGHMPKAAPANDDDDDEDEDADSDAAPARGVKRPRHRATAAVAVTINPGARPGNTSAAKKKPAVQAASGSTNAGAILQPASSVASASNDTTGSVQSSIVTGTAFTPINGPGLGQTVESSPSASDDVNEANSASPTPSVAMKSEGSSQPASPDASNADGWEKSVYFAAPVFNDQRATEQAVLAQARLAREELDNKYKFPGPLGNTMQQYGSQMPQTAGSGTNQQPIPASQVLLPHQSQQFQHLPPPPDYATSQRAAHGLQPIGLRPERLTQAYQQSQMQERTHPQSPGHYQGPPGSSVFYTSSVLNYHPPPSPPSIRACETRELWKEYDLEKLWDSHLHQDPVNQESTLNTPEWNFWSNTDEFPIGGQQLQQQGQKGTSAPPNSPQANLSSAEQLTVHENVQQQGQEHTSDRPASPRADLSSAAQPTVDQNVQKQDQEGTQNKKKKKKPRWCEFLNLDSDQYSSSDDDSAPPSPKANPSSPENPAVDQNMLQQYQQGTSAPTFPQVNQPSATTAAAANEAPETSTAVTPTVRPRDIPLDEMDPTDAEAIRECRRVAVGGRHRDTNGKELLYPGEVPSMFTGVAAKSWSWSTGERNGGGNDEEKPQGS